MKWFFRFEFADGVRQLRVFEPNGLMKKNYKTKKSNKVKLKSYLAKNTKNKNNARQPASRNS